jgi:microcystin-dependent protein
MKNAPYIAEIRLFGFRELPDGWIPCDGRVLRVRDNQPLFALLGWRFGGDGWTTFALPDLRQRYTVPVVIGIAEQGVLSLYGGDNV